MKNKDNKGPLLVEGRNALRVVSILFAWESSTRMCVFDEAQLWS